MTAFGIHDPSKTLEKELPAVSVDLVFCFAPTLFAMGKKLEAETLKISDGNHAIKDEKRRKKKEKSKTKESKPSAVSEEENGTLELSEAKRRRTHEDHQALELAESNGIDAEKRRKKKKKSKETSFSEEGNGNLKAEIEETKEIGGVIVSGKETKESKYKALNSFAESGLPNDVLECCKNFSKPSPIQSHAWPFLLDGRDFIGIAATGSGNQSLLLLLSLLLCSYIHIYLSCDLCSWTRENIGIWCSRAHAYFAKGESKKCEESSSSLSCVIAHSRISSTS